jgi:hypothetical protein
MPLSLFQKSLVSTNETHFNKKKSLMTLATGLEAVRRLYLLRRQRGAEFSRILVEQANMLLFCHRQGSLTEMEDPVQLTSL